MKEKALMATRTHLSLNVSDLDEAVDFYSKLLGMEPSKRRPGYANFASDSPPLKLALVESEDAAGQLNHLGIEVASSADVTAANNRLTGEGLTTAEEIGTTCCYATQDKVWVTDPDGASWEVYTVLSDSQVERDDNTTCCTSEKTEAGCCSTVEQAQGCCA
jgi:catechol 2,3-dioxygenase-like lactoylglutathione lyase family enzyme